MNGLNNCISKWKGKYKNKPLKIAFCIFNDYPQLVSIPISSISAYIKEHNTNIDVKLFHIIEFINEEKYNPEGFSNYLKNWGPDIFAISILSTHWDGIKPYLSEIKKQIPNLLILVGGYQAILKSEETINFPPIDFLCDGDGEIPTDSLIKYLRGERKESPVGLWEKLPNGTILKTPKYNLEDLTSIPFPDYTIYEINGSIKVTNLNSRPVQKRFLPVMTGRGCLYNCTYCSNSTLRKMWPNKKSFMRKYDLDLYVDELIRLRDRYEIEYFEFWDELFFGDVPWVLALFDEYRKRVKIPFSVVSRIEVMDYERCKKAADAGCEAIYFGIESGSEEYRRKYLKRFDKNQQIIDAAENCLKVGIKRITFNIMGMPFETKEQMIETLELNKLINPEYFCIFTYIPLKGTKLYDVAEENDLLYDSLRTIHYQKGMYDGSVKMNIKPTTESATEAEFNEVAKLMAEFEKEKENFDY